MTGSQKPKLSVYTDSRRNFIQAPSDQIHDIRSHLRSHGITSFHPSPITPGIESIEIPPRSDMKAVQLLLDAWSKN